MDVVSRLHNPHEKRHGKCRILDLYQAYLKIIFQTCSAASYRAELLAMNGCCLLVNLPSLKATQGKQCFENGANLWIMSVVVGSVNLSERVWISSISYHYFCDK